MASLLGTFSRKSSSNYSTTENAEEINFDVEKALRKWKYPKVAVKDVYKVGLLEWSPNYSIETVEKTVRLGSSHETFQLVSEGAIDEHKKKYSILHLGSVQVAVKPLTRQGLNTVVLACVRDTRFIKFNDSLLGIIESSLREGPFYFNVFPSYPISLQDKSVHTLEIITQGSSMESGFQDLEISYRVHYSARQNVLYGTKKSFTGGRTTLFQTNLKTKAVIPRIIKWDEVRIPECWTSNPETTTENVENTRSDLSLPELAESMFDGREC